MSNIYVTEPPTEGKVLLHTSFGDLDVELWPQQAPKACRNFVQLCLEGFYDKTIFHRVIPGFMVQGGDPTGTGTGGESVFGGPFNDEFHSRLRFNHRGLLAMANENKPNSNHSQFFFTLDACEFLDKKHTIFGKITGNTIFNLLSVGDIDTDAKDRPVNPPKLLSVEVLWNPFDDVVPRDIQHAKAADESTAAEDALKKRKRERKATKDLNLLSFGDEEETFEASSKQKGKRKKMMSSHDLLDDKKLKAEVDADLLQKIAEAEPATTDKGLDEEPEKKAKLSAKDSLKAAVAAASTGKPATVKDLSSATTDEQETGITEKSSKKKEKKEKKPEVDEYQQLRAELKKSRQAVPLIMGERARELEKERAVHDMLTPLQQQRKKYLERKKAASRSSRQHDTLEKLKSFQATLMAANSKASSGANTTGGDEQEQVEEKGEAYNGQVLESDGEDDPKGDMSWMTAKLKFKKHIDDQFRAGAGQSVDDYLTIDSRTEAASGAGRGSRGTTGGRNRSRDRSHRERDGRGRSRSRSRSRDRDRGSRRR